MDARLELEQDRPGELELLAPPSPDLLLPAGARLLHIGVPKTGTTSLQSALQEARDRLPPLGVVYPGTDRYHYRASVAAVGATPRLGDPAPDPRAWQTLVRQVQQAGDARVVVSSEWFCEADAQAARRIVDGLGGDRVHVVVTLRPLARILPSSWQQYVQNGMRTSYEAWLDGMLRRPPYDAPTASFWRRHRHAEIVWRWADVVGPERVTVLVVDEGDRTWLLRRFEELVGLPAGTLEQHERANPSLNRSQAEVVRRLNGAFREREWPDRLYRQVVRIAVAERLARGSRGSGIGTPQWALDRAAELAGEAVREIGASGVRVVGDLDALTQRPPAVAPGAVQDLALPAATTAEVLADAIDAARTYGHEEGYRAAREKYYVNALSWRRHARAARAWLSAQRAARR